MSGMVFRRIADGKILFCHNQVSIYRPWLQLVYPGEGLPNIALLRACGNISASFQEILCSGVPYHMAGALMHLPMCSNPAGHIRTLNWIDRQVAPVWKMLQKIDCANGTHFLRGILNNVELTERHKKLIKEQTTSPEEVIQRDVLLQLFPLLLLLLLMYIMILMLKRGG